MILKWSISLSIKIIVFIDFFAVALVIPLIQTYFREAGIDTKLLGLISSAYMISQLCGTLLGGHIVDNLNKRTILLLSFTSSALSYLMIIVGFKFKSGVIMLLSRIVVGLFKNTYTVSTAIIAHVEVADAKVVSLGHLGATMTSAFIVGPILGGLLYKYMNILPCIVSSMLFLLNIALTFMLIPQDVCVIPLKEQKLSESNKNETFQSRMSDLWSRLLSISSIPNVGSLLTIRLMLSFFESATSSRSIIGYFEKRYNIEVAVLGYISSLSSCISILCDGFLLPSILSITSFISNTLFIPLLIFLSASFSIIEFFNTSIYLYVCITIIPQTLIQSVLGAKIKALQLESIATENFGKFLSVLSLLGTGVGVISPLYSAILFSNVDGIVYRPLVSAAHLMVLSFICFLLPLRDVKKKVI